MKTIAGRPLISGVLAAARDASADTPIGLGTALAPRTARFTARIYLTPKETDMLDRMNPDPLKLDTYGTWLGNQPADEAYVYTDPYTCPTARYFTELGHSEVEVVPGLVTFTGGEMKLPVEFDIIACNGEHTYGAAFDRALALAQT